jgi:hypothetical protein
MCTQESLEAEPDTRTEQHLLSEELNVITVERITTNRTVAATRFIVASCVRDGTRGERSSAMSQPSPDSSRLHSA